MDWSFTNLLKLSYWFAVSTPPLRWSSFIAALIFLGALFVGGILLRILARKKRRDPSLARGLRRMARPFFFLAILGFVLVWFRQLGAAMLSARFWLALIFIIAAVWFVFIIKSFLQTYKSERAKLEKQKKYREYLPKKNR